jgi:hypothetical protein
MIELLSLKEYLHERIERSRINLVEAADGGDNYELGYARGKHFILLTILAQVEDFISQERA